MMIHRERGFDWRPVIGRGILRQRLARQNETLEHLGFWCAADHLRLFRFVLAIGCFGFDGLPGALFRGG